MNGDVRPSAYGLNVFAQKLHSSYDAKQLPVDTGAFASIGLPHKQKLLDVHLDVEKTAEKAHDIDVTGATAELDKLVKGLRAFGFARSGVLVGLLRADPDPSMVKPVMLQQVLGVAKRIRALPCMAGFRRRMGLQRKNFSDTAKEYPPRTDTTHRIHAVLLLSLSSVVCSYTYYGRIAYSI